MNNVEHEHPFMHRHRDVQQKLGRCMLRLQQIEILVKALWVDHEYECHGGDFLIVQAERRDSVSERTLGSVVKALTGSYLSSDLGKENDDTLPEDPNVDPTKISIRFKSLISMTEDDYARTVGELEALVKMRNELVHQFIQRFDLWSESGCDAASAYLDECALRIDTQHKMMRGWAKVHQEAKEASAAFLQSEEGLRFFTYGIFPDGTVDWSSTPIVAVLRQAELNLAKNGWTSLNEAVRWLDEKYPDIKPEQYGCSRWRHLLHESGLFEIRRVSSGQPGPTEAYFRSRDAQA